MHSSPLLSNSPTIYTSSKSPLYDSVSIECCYINEDGSFTDETYEALIELLTWLMKEYDLTTDNILRHYDCGGKKCPLYYVENEEQWQQLKEDVEKSMKSYMNMTDKNN